MIDPMAHGRLVYFARLLPYARDEHELRSFIAECRLSLLALDPPSLNGEGRETERETERAFLARLDREAGEVAP